MSPTKRVVLLAIYGVIAIGCIIGIFRSTFTQAEFTIKASIQASTQDEDYVGLMALKEYVEQKSEGRIQVQLYASGQFASILLRRIGSDR